VRRTGTAWIIGACLVASACSQASSSNPSALESASNSTSESASESGPSTSETTETTQSTETTESSTTSSSPSSTSSSTTTTTVPELDVYDPQCVVQVVPGDSLGAIAEEIADEIVTVASLQAENGLTGDLIVPDQLLDVCIDNGLDDITGDQRLERNAEVIAGQNNDAIATQQAKLNALLTPFGFPEMPVDGISGPITRRALCASRVALGLPVNRDDMIPGSVEERWFLASPALPVPPNVGGDGKWIFMDMTCQVMFTGEGTGQLVNIFPTSTGEPEFETRPQERTRAFRYDPALQNDGWHESSLYPVPVDNPLNGNMYKPLYFDGGQAIHGANNVPTSPQSKGCARLRPSDMDRLVSWLGLADIDGPTNSADRIGVTVTARGSYQPG
jgi:LysM repeat protein